MTETKWYGPHGTVVTIRNGSRKPPRWALLLIDRVAHRNPRKGGWVDLRWVQGNGGGYYYPGARIVAVRAAGMGRSLEKEVLMHELAHWLDRSPRGRGHGDSFFVEFLRIARDEGGVRLLAGYPKAKLARARAALKEAA